MAEIAALRGVKPNFGGGGIKAGIKRAGVIKTDKVIISFVKKCLISSFQSREWLLYIMIVILQHIMASTKRNNLQKILQKEMHRG